MQRLQSRLRPVVGEQGSHALSAAGAALAAALLVAALLGGARILEPAIDGAFQCAAAVIGGGGCGGAAAGSTSSTAAGGAQNGGTTRQARSYADLEYAPNDPNTYAPLPAVVDIADNVSERPWWDFGGWTNN